MTDSKASDRDVSRAIRSWLHEDRHEDASRIAGAVLDHVEAAPERRAGWPAWRTPTMNRFITFGLAAAVVVIGLFLGYQLLGSPSNTGSSGPTATPEPTGTPTSTPEPTPSPVSAPPLTGSFTSTLHGISISYPEGWTAQAATEPWKAATFPLEFGQPHADWLSDPTHTHNLFLTVASQPIGDATAEDWMAAQMASDEGCAAAQPVEVDSSTGLIGAATCNVAVVTTGGRGYWIQLYTSGDDPAAIAPYDKAWFEEVLATVQLHPEDAVD